ncbi:MAG TPA: phage virion morphogenesis protein [Candidatus Ozemobacteraceae bacterium]|nr:phage virion morphogenesis protein [Candidatus Ozemobacteraceae bacterium]
MNSIIDLKLEDEGVKDLLKRLQKRLSNLRAPMDSIGQLILNSVERNFEVGGRYSGTSGDVMGGMIKWDRLAPSTVKRRYREGSWPGKILQISGRLAASIHAKASRDSVIVGTNAEYAAIHQFGGVIQMKGKSMKMDPTISRV